MKSKTTKNPHSKMKYSLPYEQMKEIDLQTIRQIQVNILDYVINACKVNGLRVSLDSGTLIGAVRHKGYIPWDDDIDITLPRSDYNKLIDLLKDDISPYALLCSTTVDSYSYPFAKVVDTRTRLIEDNVDDIQGYGIYIDIFPQDDLPNDEKTCIAFQRRIKALRNRVSYAVNNNWDYSMIISHPKYLIKCLMYSKLGWRKSLVKLEKYVQKYNSNKAIYCEQLLSSSNPYRKGLKSFFDTYVDVEFEGKKYPAISEYDKYLRNIYGDYMQLPPIEDRVRKHSYKAFWITE